MIIFYEIYPEAVSWLKIQEILMNVFTLNILQ